MVEELVEWVKLPQDLQHRFFELAEEEAGRVAKTIQELDSQLKDLKERLQPYMRKLPSSNEVLTVAAVDSSRSPRLSERLGIRYGVFATGLLYLKGIEKRDEVFRAGVFKRKQALSQDKSRHSFDLYTMYAERRLASEALDRCDVLILDGSFYGFVYPAQRMKRIGFYGPQEDQIVKETYEFTEKLRRSGKAIGVIKRSHTRAIGGYLALKDRSNPFITVIDKLILSTFMPERTIFAYQDLIGDRPVQVYTQLALLASMSMKWDGEPLQEAERRAYAPFETLGLPEDGVKEMRRLQVRAFRDVPPCEIEYPSSISLDRLVGWLGQENLFNESTNLPIALDLVDGMVGLSAKFTDEFVSEVEGRVLETIARDQGNHEAVKMFFMLLNPQKPY